MKSQLGLHVLYLLYILNFSLMYNTYKLYFINARHLVPLWTNDVKIPFISFFMPKREKNGCQKILKQNLNISFTC